MQIHLKSSIFATSIFGLMALAGAASAEITSITVDSSQPFDGAIGYQYVEATMNGTVERDDGSLGEYSVPVILIHPHDGGNGAAVVDLVNTVLIQFGLIDDMHIAQYALGTTGAYLFDEGFTYLAVQWDKVTTDIFEPDCPEVGNHLACGSIQAHEDTFEIIRDAARFLRDPAEFQGSAPPAAVDAVISAGYSQPGFLQNTIVRQGEDYDNGELLFDGHLIKVAGSLCLDLEISPIEPVLCGDPAPDDGARIIMIESQTDLEADMFASTFTRYTDNPNFRRYELAGVSHIPKDYFFLHTAQNPVDPSPIFRGAYRNLLAWILWDISPPPSKFLDGTLNPDGSLNAVYDSDSNIVGGLRLPHMAAPLGTYTGLWLDGETLFDLLSGTFTPFDDTELAERYPNPGAYVSTVAKAAESLLDDGYILPQDKNAYVREAARSGIGRRSGGGR